MLPRGFASTGLGRVRRAGTFRVKGGSDAVNFSVCGRIRVVRCRRWSIRRRFTGKS
uniref:Uncharacterized protein n=1 Tax=Candidatus Methanogaster sp. ANME-2c ERB4 TaxID=2759911 RepID=A0A7G9YLS7_9EURY|nr:hypothetical protein OEPDFBKK_00037 [Methanosarcinales archaeon ANME-2c ERB4]